jgi:tRNA A37 N6-isopentenylltransferase MiaA
MQLYRGVDILSAKATLEERALVPHECLDMFDDVTEDTFNVASYQSHAISVIHQREREARARGARSLPILVGGTNLYIEALLWPNLYQFNQSPSSSSSLSSLNPEGTEEQATPTVSHRHLQTWDGDSKTNEELYQELKRVDPIKANQLHPNDLRKVLRALLRARTNTPTEGKKGEKDNGDDGNDVENKGAPNGRRGGIGADGVSAIADRIVYVWVRCERGELLVERLNSRVDAMVAEGLERELKFIRQQFIARRKSMDFEKGVLQSIGIREFAQWMMTLPDDGPDNHPSFSLPDHKASSRQTAASTSPSPTPTYSLDQFNTAVSKTKSNTVRYAKKQIKWLTRHFFPTLYHQSKSVLSDVNHGRHQQSHPATVVVVDSSNSDDYKRVGLPQACATISCSFPSHKWNTATLFDLRTNVIFYLLASYLVIGPACR